MMKYLLALLFGIVATSAYAQENIAYVIIGASNIEASVPQPKWFGLAKKRRIIHIETNGKIVDVEAGTYRLHHLDFREDPHVSPDSQTFENKMKLKFEAGAINFIGHFLLRGRPVRPYDISLDQDTNYILEACLSNPDLFEKYPLSVPNSTKKMWFSCKDKSNGETQ